MTYALTYYTPDVPIYADAVTLWIADCVNAGLEFHVRERPSHGVRSRNCLEKLYVIRDASQEFELPLLWIDADSRIRRRPAFLDGCTADFVARRNLQRPSSGFAGYVMYFGDTDHARELIRRMCLFADYNQHLADEGCTREAVFSMWNELNFQQLPETCSAGAPFCNVPANDPAAEIVPRFSSRKVSKLMPMRGKRSDRKVDVPPEFAA